MTGLIGVLGGIIGFIIAAVKSTVVTGGLGVIGNALGWIGTWILGLLGLG